MTGRSTSLAGAEHDDRRHPDRDDLRRHRAGPPTTPTGWTFGTPTLSDSQAPTTDGTVVITTKDATYEVIVTNTISRDLGSLKISKVFDPLTSGFVGHLRHQLRLQRRHRP